MWCQLGTNVYCVYGVLHGDGTLDELPNVDAACTEYDEFICYDAEDHVVARFPSRGVMFGELEVLRRIAPRLERLIQKAIPPAA